MKEAIKVNMGELKTGKEGDMLAAYGVGSCVIVVCYDREKPIAAMLHAVLPEKLKKSHNENKYAEVGIDNLVKMLLENGVSIKDMEAKLYGGAKMFDVRADAEAIGDRNVKKAREMLGRKGIVIAAEDTGYNYGRSIEFDVSSKKANVKSFLNGVKVV